uniref:Uncharacterized protein n=1 Tax=Arundo donax TaxID=35708 RepID=A0A0A9EAS4_ARUDO
MNHYNPKKSSCNDDNKISFGTAPNLKKSSLNPIISTSKNL